MLIAPALNLAVQFVWLDGAGEPVDVSATGASLSVAISNSDAVEWIPHGSDAFRGTFDPGPFTDVETAMRVTLTQDGDTLFRSPLLQLHVRSP